MWDGNAHLSQDERALIRAAKETGDCAEARRLLAAGVGVDIRDGHNMPWNQTPLMLAAHNGFLELAQILLAAGASVSAVDKNAGESEGEHEALHHAVLGQNRAVVEAILDAGADINALTDEGNTPLNMAIRRGDLELVKVIVRRGAAVTKFGRKRYRPPLYVAAETEMPSVARRAIIEFLLKAGADPNAIGSRGDTTLKKLAAVRDVDDEDALACLAALIRAGAKDLPDKNGWAGLHFATCFGNLRAALMLIEAGSNVNQISKIGTPVDLASERVENARRNLTEANQLGWDRAGAERDLQVSEELVRQLRARGGKRQAELSAAEFVTADAVAPTGASAVTTKSTARTAKPPPLGVKHFLKLVDDGEREWSLIAVQAPREQVTDALSRRYKTAKVLRGVELKKPRKNDALARRLAIIRVKDNPWTIVLRSLYYVDGGDVGAVAEDAKILSQQLKTSALSFVAEDTSGAVQFDLFENGEPVERVQWSEGGSFSVFESTRRKQPKLAEVDGRFADKTVRDLGIYLPACYPRANQRTAWVCVEKVSAEHVDSADLMELK
jgi:ankyrin repeat protein